MEGPRVRARWRRAFVVETSAERQRFERLWCINL